MLTDDFQIFFDNLPDEPLEALLVVEERIRNNKVGTGSIDQWRHYVACVEAFCEEYNVIFPPFGLHNELSSAGDNDEIQSYLRDAAKARFQLAARISRERKASQLSTEISRVELSDSAKEEIKSLLQEIRKRIDKLSIEPNKRDSLFAKLAEFGLELDRSQTRLGAFLSAMIEVSAATGVAAEKLEPLVSLFERVSRAIGLDLSGTRSFPRWEEPKRLPAPESSDD